MSQEIRGKARLAKRNDSQNRWVRAPWVQVALVFFVSYLLLFAGMTRLPGMYDEGIVLTAAMRVAAGQIPHRDFYFIYGPAEIYTLAGIFKVFGQSLLAERLFDISIKSLLVAAVFSIGSSYYRKTISVFVTAVTLLWLFGLNEFGIATTPVSLLNLLGCSLVVAAFTGEVTARRMFTAGAISGIAALFRYDTGFALAGIHGCVLAIATYSPQKGTRNNFVRFSKTFWPYLLGFFVLTIPPAIYYVSRAPLSDLLHDVVVFPAKYYHRGRNLPLPGIDIKSLENLGVYLPLAIAAVAFYAVFNQGLWGYRSNKTDAEIDRQRAWLGLLITFGMLLLVMFLKGLVRVSPLQMYLAIVPSLLIAGVLLEHQDVFPPTLQILIPGLLYLSLIPATWSALHQLRLEELRYSSVTQRLISRARKRSPQEEWAWCGARNALTRGFCFQPEDDRMRAIDFIDEHTQPNETLFAGLSHHDKVFANDNIIYFATQRLPATRWSHFDPDLQNQKDIQLQMIDEIEKKRPPYVVLNSEFELVREPNDSAKSSGVSLLDSYIQSAYQPTESFGTISILQRRKP